MLRIVLPFAALLIANAASAQTIGRLDARNNLSDLASPSTARSSLGLGTMATQNANSVAITGGSINGTTVGAANSSTGNFTNLNANVGLFGNGNYITYNGAPTSNQYGVQVNNSVGGTTNSQYGINNFIVSGDNTQGSGLNWLTVYGNLGSNMWAPSTAYSAGQVNNNGGNIYQVTTAGTSAASGGPTGTGTSISDGSVVWKYLNPDFSGNRGGFSASIEVNGRNSASTDDQRQYQAGIFTTYANAPQGGTQPHSGQSGGFFYGSADQMWCEPGALNISGCVGHEIDTAIFTGASAAQRTGLQIVSYGNLQGFDHDGALRLANITGAPGWKMGIELDAGGIDPAGEILQGWADPAGTSPFTAAEGIDFSGFKFTAAAFRSPGNFLVDGQGTVSTGSARLSTSGATTTLDAPGSVVSAAVPSNGGSSYAVGDQVWDHNTGTVLTVSAVSSGAVTGLTVTIPGGVTGSTPANPVSFVGGSGGSLTVNLTWAADTTLAVGGGSRTVSLSPGGGVTKIGGHAAFTGTKPSLGSCGTSPSLDSAASDAAGTVTEGSSSTGCTITWAAAYSTAPHCVVSSPSGSAFTSYTPSTASLVIANSSASGNKYTYYCVQ